MASVWLDCRVAWLLEMPGIHDVASLKPTVELVKVPGTYEVSPLPKCPSQHAAALGIDVAPTAGYRGALARPVNRFVDKVFAKPQAARPCNEDLIPPTRPTFRLHRAQCSEKKCL